MVEDAWSFGVILMALAVPVALALAVISLTARRSSQKRYVDEEVWASVRLAYVEQADGILPVGVVRVQNPDITPVIVSVSSRSPRLRFGHHHHFRWCRRPLSVRSPSVRRRPRPPQGTLLGAVTGGAVGVWQFPVGRPDRLRIVRVRLDQVGPRSKVFSWALHKAPATEAKTAQAEVPRRLVLAE